MKNTDVTMLEVQKWEKLNKIVEEFMNSKRFENVCYPYLNMFSEMSVELLSEPTKTSTSNIHLKKFSLNESIKIIYDFLKTIDLNLANQFINVIRATDENKKPMVFFVENGFSGVKPDGSTHIGYRNNIDDLFCILHEMLHKLNETSFIDLEKGDFAMWLYSREYFTEAVSVMGENLLGEYLVSKNIATKMDLFHFETERFNDAKCAAKFCLFGCELFKMKLRFSSLDLNHFNLYLERYPKESIVYKELKGELELQRKINIIIQKENLIFSESLRYVIAWYLTNHYKNDPKKIEKFLELHSVTGSIYSDIHEVMEQEFQGLILK